MYIFYNSMQKMVREKKSYNHSLHKCALSNLMTFVFGNLIFNTRVIIIIGGKYAEIVKGWR